MKKNNYFGVAGTSSVEQLGEYVPKGSDTPLFDSDLEWAVAEKSKGLRVHVDDYEELPRKAWFLLGTGVPTTDNHYSLEYIEVPEMKPGFLNDEEVKMEPMNTHGVNLETALWLFKEMASSLSYAKLENRWVTHDSKLI